MGLCYSQTVVKGVPFVLVPEAAPARQRLWRLWWLLNGGRLHHFRRRLPRRRQRPRAQ